ncbi:MAG: Holliday junction resolvase RuvX [Porphyromonas sp.]|jgi:RNAse H domain protein, YqgF family|nr:Holliday junction resolvase RuvX [Porphyromonas sp.]RKW46771.1 MAG: Holliday junction resolvase RuvX [Porphyromonas sp.]
MARLLAIDYGRKRCGLAVTDILQITPGGLATVRTHELIDYLKNYIAKEPVERFIIGLPMNLNGKESESMTYLRPFLKQLEKAIPNIPVTMVDERFTSTLAQRTIIEAGIGKQRRREDKGLVDEVSAVIILQTYMSTPRF